MAFRPLDDLQAATKAFLRRRDPRQPQPSSGVGPAVHFRVEVLWRNDPLHAVQVAGGLGADCDVASGLAKRIPRTALLWLIETRWLLRRPGSTQLLSGERGRARRRRDGSRPRGGGDGGVATDTARHAPALTRGSLRLSRN